MVHGVKFEPPNVYLYIVPRDISKTWLTTPDSIDTTKKFYQFDILFSMNPKFLSIIRKTNNRKEFCCILINKKFYFLFERKKEKNFDAYHPNSNFCLRLVKFDKCASVI